MEKTLANRALITGVAGQDGSYLAELLLKLGYEVHGALRSHSNEGRLEQVVHNPKFKRHYDCLGDVTRFGELLDATEPDEIYHLAGQSHVGQSFKQGENSGALLLGVVDILPMVKGLKKSPRFFHASSSEIFGRTAMVPQTEKTPIFPSSPYGCTKAYTTHLVRVYREGFGLFCCNGILYNHESVRRGENFVTRKVCRAAARIKLKKQEVLLLGNLETYRDWGYAPDYVHGMWATLQQENPDDYIFATGKLHSIRDLAETAFAALGLHWEDHVKVDPALFRPVEPGVLQGDFSKAKSKLGWENKMPFQQMIHSMVENEILLCEKEIETPLP